MCDGLLELHTGSRQPADGMLRESAGLDIAESLLTGEFEPVAKDEGEQVRSGSIGVAGHGRFPPTAVGAQACAAGLATEANG